MEIQMPAFNVVRFRVKPGNEQQFIEAHASMRPTLKGFVGGHLVRTGDRTFCMVGEWRNFQSIVDARPHMISMLDQVRDLLEELGSDLGVTDPVSGESVVRLGAPKAAKKRAAKPRGAKKRAASKKPAGRKTAKRAKKSAAKRGR
jgi:quinol monooxygenase YgiN